MSETEPIFTRADMKHFAQVYCEKRNGINGSVTDIESYLLSEYEKGKAAHDKFFGNPQTHNSYPEGIISIKCPNAGWITQPTETNYQEWVHNSLENTAFTQIWSVKNGKEVLTVGDEVCYLGSGTKWKIARFVITMKNELIAQSEACGNVELVSTLMKIERKPVITIEGKDLYEGDYFWNVNKKTLFIYQNKIENGSVYYIESDVERFLTLEAAQKYLDENEKKYSIARMKEAAYDIFWSSTLKEKWDEFLKKLT